MCCFPNEGTQIQMYNNILRNTVMGLRNKHLKCFDLYYSANGNSGWLRPYAQKKRLQSISEAV
jgi:hypothetical protein